MTIPRDLSNLAPGANTSGVLQPSKGGTGLTSPGTSGNVLTSNGTAWVSSAPTSAGSGGATASGNVTLTSASSGAQSITTTAFGQYVALPNATTMSKGAMLFSIENVGPYPLRVKNSAGSTLGFIYPQEATMVGLSDNSTAAGVWNLSNVDPIAQTAVYLSTTLFNLTKIREVRVDSDRLLFTYGDAGSNLYAQLYNETTQTWGTPTLVRSSAGYHIAAVTGSNQALVCSCNTSTAFQAVVLTFSGTTITVGTAASATNASGASNFFDILSIGSSWVVSYTSPNTCRAMTISGTTVSIGGEVTQTGTSSTYVMPVAVSSSVFFVVSTTVSTLYVETYSVSGTTITTGSSATVTNSGDFRFAEISSGSRWILLYGNTTVRASIVSISGTTPTLSSVDTGMSGVSTVVTSGLDFIVSGSKAIIVVASTTAALRQANIVTDTSGTASVGTAINIPIQGNYVVAVSVSGSVANFISSNNSFTTSNRIGLNFSSSSPTVEQNTDSIIGSTAYFYAGTFTSASFNSNFTNRKYGVWLYGTVNYCFYQPSATQIGEIMALQNQHIYKAITRARPPLQSPSGSNIAGVSANEYVYYFTNYQSISAYGAVFRYESIT